MAWFSYKCLVCGTVRTEQYYDISHRYLYCSRQCAGKAIQGEQNPGFKGRRWLGEYIVVYQPGHPKTFSRGEVLEHILIAERALGHYLPPGAVVHHINEVKSDNRPENLVICQDDSYHQLLHVRMDRQGKFGSPNRKRCYSCHKVKDLAEFAQNDQKIDGYSRYCLLCFFRRGQFDTQRPHCPHGHPFTADNTYIDPDGKRSCRECNRAAGRAYVTRKYHERKALETQG